jgi:signal transduction histidine kinase
VKGSGLGLPIVRKIVDAHDGRIDVSSAPQVGTRFRVTLPVSSASGWFK